MCKKALKELNLRNQYGINVLGIRKNPHEKLSISPSAYDLLEKDDQLMVIADNQVIEKIESLYKNRSVHHERKIYIYSKGSLC